MFHELCALSYIHSKFAFIGNPLWLVHNIWHSRYTDVPLFCFVPNYQLPLLPIEFWRGNISKFQWTFLRDNPSLDSYSWFCSFDAETSLGKFVFFCNHYRLSNMHDFCILCHHSWRNITHYRDKIKVNTNHRDHSIRP